MTANKNIEPVKGVGEVDAGGAARGGAQVPKIQERQSKKGKRNQLRIAFFGNFGRGNFGNDSTLQAILCNLRRLAPSAEFSCICTGPETVASDYNITAVPSRDYVIKPWTLQNAMTRLARRLLVGVPCELYRWLDSVFTLWGTDALIVPGTGLLTDVSTLLNWGPYDMFRWSLAAKLCGCKLFFVSVGAGPINSRIGKFFIKAALALSDFRSYRDESTLDRLKDIGLRAENDRIFPDLVFSLPGSLMPHRDLTKGRRLVVGLGLMEDARRYGVERSTSFAHAAYLESLAEFANWLLAQGYDVHLLIGAADDTPVTQELISLLKTRCAAYDEERIINKPVQSVENLLSQLEGTDLIVATRFHNVLLSLLLNKPVIAISFHHKCSSLMSQMGLSEYCLDIAALNGEKLIEQFRRLQQNAGSVQQRIHEKVKTCQHALDEQYDMIFGEICPDNRRLFARAV
ncbi:MAG: polysaccharide pyruvyl transferase family protein [Terracidiphilus sp.]